MEESLGPLGLFFSAFLAATILPFSSEAAFAAALYGGMDKNTALVTASTGNILAIVVNFVLGLLLYEATHAKLENSRFGKKALAYAHEKGYWALILSPLPLIGDPITLAAGMVRLRFVWFLLIAGSLRVARYALIMAML
jgi:membrane protein YqaA with SNARE-associated domain